MEGPSLGMPGSNSVGGHAPPGMGGLSGSSAQNMHLGGSGLGMSPGIPGGPPGGGGGGGQITSGGSGGGGGGLGGLGVDHQPQPLSTRNSNLMNIPASNNKALGQLSSSSLTAAYSHLWDRSNMMGSMPIYDIGDYQHL